MLTIKGPDLANHKFKGYKAGETAKLTCSACGRDLVDLVVVLEMDVALRYRAKCPHCGDHSYPIELFGQVLLSPCDEKYTVVDIPIEELFMTAILKEVNVP